MIQLAKRSLNEAHNSLILGVGALLYIWSGVQIFLQLEQSMNEMWEVSSSGSFFSKVRDYIALFFLAPILAAVSITMTAYFAGGLEVVDTYLEGYPFLLTLFYIVFNTIPFLLSWSLITFIYVYLPSTKVRIRPALIAAGITAFFFELVQWGYFIFQSGLSSYNTVYGTLVALPLLLLWVNISWTLILLGGKIAFAIQHSNPHGFHHHSNQVAHKVFCALSLRIISMIVERWAKEKPPLSDEEISRELNLPQGLINFLLEELQASGLIAELSSHDQGARYFQPGMNTENLTVVKVLDVLRSKGDALTFLFDEQTEKIKKLLDKIDALGRESKQNILIRDL